MEGVVGCAFSPRRCPPRLWSLKDPANAAEHARTAQPIKNLTQLQGVSKNFFPDAKNIVRPHLHSFFIFALLKKHCWHLPKHTKSVLPSFALPLKFALPWIISHLQLRGVVDLLIKFSYLSPLQTALTSNPSLVFSPWKSIGGKLGGLAGLHAPARTLSAAPASKTPRGHGRLPPANPDLNLTP